MNATPRPSPGGHGSGHASASRRPNHRIGLFLAGAAILAIGTTLYVRRSVVATAQDPLAQAQGAYAKGRWAEAGSLARERLKVASADDTARRLVARATARQDKDAAAIAAFSRLELSSMEGEDYFLLGRALARTGKYDLALKALEAAKDGKGDDPSFLDELGRAYFREHRPAAAVSIAERLVKLPGWEARGNFLLGPFRAEVNDPTGAASALGRGFELDPEARAASPQEGRSLRLLLIRSLLQSGKPAEARRELERISNPGSDTELAWLLSRCFIQEKDWVRATATLELAKTYRRDHPIEPEPAVYVGAARCSACHKAEAEAYAGTRHSRTFLTGRDLERVSLPEGSFTDPADKNVRHNFRHVPGGIQVETHVRDRVFRAIARYAFGTPEHYTTLVGKDEGGTDRQIRISAYHSPRGSGWDISTGLDPHPPQAEDYLGPAIPAVDGERKCLRCHTTNFRAIETGMGPEAADHSIGCEVCHGPGGNHVAAAEVSFADMAIIHPGRYGGSTTDQMCGLCHSGTEPIRYTGADDDPGWFRFQALRLEKSRCYLASGGRLHCSTCHDPHRDVDRSTSHADTKCLSCHDAGKVVCPTQPAGRCVECHMQRKWREQTHSEKIDHWIRVLPEKASRP